jgi:hypothetical protein
VTSDSATSPAPRKQQGPPLRNPSAVEGRVFSYKSPPCSLASSRMSRPFTRCSGQQCTVPWIDLTQPQQACPRQELSTLDLSPSLDPRWTPSGLWSPCARLPVHSNDAARPSSIPISLSLSPTAYHNILTVSCSKQDVYSAGPQSHPLLRRSSPLRSPTTLLRTASHDGTRAVSEHSGGVGCIIYLSAARLSWPSSSSSLCSGVWRRPSDLPCSTACPGPPRRLHAG